MYEGKSLLIVRWNLFNPNFFYFTGIDIDHTILLISEKEKIIFTNEINYELCKKELGKKFEIKKMNLKEIKSELNKKTNILIDGNIPTYLFKQIKNKNMKIGYVEFKKIREVKNKKEIEKIKTATNITREIFKKIEVDEKYEHEIKNEILIETLKKNCEKAFEPIIANSQNTRFPHYNKFDSKVKDYCLIDYGVEFEKYKSDLTICKGDLGRNEKKYEELKNSVYEIADSSYAGMKIKDFIKNVDRIISKNNLEKFNHTIGHGVGLEVHEFPILSVKNNDYLKKNSIITIEPGQYNKKNGLRYEEIFIVENKKIRKI
jgi:Xaa-Pro aminopeptidase